MRRRIVYMGMGGVYSLIPLEVLVEGGVEVAAVFFPRLTADDKGPRWMPAAAQPPSDPELVVRPVRETILTVAGAHGIAVLEVGSMRDVETLAAVEDLRPDLVVVACFPQILPEAFLKIPRVGCLNIHPSLLPAYRGPEPLFWQFRAGEQDMGVTVHWMEAGVDTGDILRQARVSFPEGITAVEADRLAAQAGVEIVLEALEKDDWPRQPQSSAGASYQGAPREVDKVIPAGWGVRRAFNFVRGADAWAPFWIEMEDGERIEVREVLGYERDGVDDSGVPRQEHGNEGEAREEGNEGEAREEEMWVQMRDGVLRVV